MPNPDDDFAPGIPTRDDVALAMGDDTLSAPADDERESGDSIDFDVIDDDIFDEEEDEEDGEDEDTYAALDYEDDFPDTDDAPGADRDLPDDFQL